MIMNLRDTMFTQAPYLMAAKGEHPGLGEMHEQALADVSTQVRELERSLGFALLKPAGRGLVLTEAGMAALRQADQIFQLGEQLPEMVRDAASSPTVRLVVGISEGLPKLVVRRKTALATRWLQSAYL
jgi:LysR family transcriptional activator of nhaA